MDANVQFTFEGIKTNIQCSKEDKMKDICTPYATKIQKDINKLFFIYNGSQLNLELTFNQQANAVDKKRNEMCVLVEKNMSTIKKEKPTKSKEIICPKCGEICLMKFNEYKIKLYECKNGHENNNILINNYYNTQDVNEKNIICEICNKYNKNITYEKQFFICLTCKNNLCPICKSNHNDKHKIIDYNNKNYVCVIHNDSFYSYCEKCKTNLCMICQSKHNKSHKILNYINFLPNVEEIKELMTEFRKKLDILNNDINGIISFLKKITENMELYYKINEDLLNNYDIRKKNYHTLKNLCFIKSNININDIDNIINNDDFNYKFNILYNIHKKLINSESTEENYNDQININNDSNDINILKNKLIRDNGLLNEQIKYLNKKIEEKEKVIENNQKKYEEKIFSLRNEVEKELREKYDKLNKEKSDIETKLLIKEKEMRELEQNLLKVEQTNELENNRLSDLYISLQKKYEELLKNYTEEKNTNLKQINSLQKENKLSKINNNNDKQEMSKRISELEKALKLKNFQCEKEQILWESKIKSVEFERDSLKNKKIECNKTLETILNKMQKESIEEKERLENNAKLTINNIEKKYEKQIKDLQDYHNGLYTELLQNKKELEKEIKNIRIENAEIKRKNKNNDDDVAKKLEEIQQEREKFIKNEKALKEQHDIKVKKINMEYENEINGYKQQIVGLEKNLKEFESKRNSLEIKLERCKAEEENLNSKFLELNNRIVSLENKNESLIRDNEKLIFEKNVLKNKLYKRNTNDKKID